MITWTIFPTIKLHILTKNDFIIITIIYYYCCFFSPLSLKKSWKKQKKKTKTGQQILKAVEVFRFRAAPCLAVEEHINGPPCLYINY